MRKMVGVMEEAQRTFFWTVHSIGAILGRLASLKGMADFWGDHYMGLPETADPDRNLTGDNFPVHIIIEEVSRCEVYSSCSCSGPYVRSSGKESGPNSKHGRV